MNYGAIYFKVSLSFGWLESIRAEVENANGFMALVSYGITGRDGDRGTLVTGVCEPNSACGALDQALYSTVPRNTLYFTFIGRLAFFRIDALIKMSISILSF